MNTARINHNTLHGQDSGPVAGPVSRRELTLLERLHNALGPLAAGIIIDVVDFAAFGPFCLLLGPILGGLAGWWVSSIYGFGTKGRLIVATAAAIYVTIPFTELLPLATMVAAVGRFYHAPAPIEARRQSTTERAEVDSPGPHAE